MSGSSLGDPAGRAEVQAGERSEGDGASVIEAAPVPWQPATDRQRLAPAAVRRRLMAADAGAVLIGVAMAFGIQWVTRPVNTTIMREHLLLFALSTPGFAGGALMFQLFRARANERPTHERLNIVRSVSVGVGVIVSLAFIAKFDELSRLWVILVAVCVTGMLFVERSVARWLFRQLRASGRLVRRIVIVGTDAHAIGLRHTYDRNREMGYDVLGFVGSDDLGERAGVRVLGDFDEIERVLAEHAAVGVVVSLPGVDSAYVNRITRRLTDSGYHVSLSASLSDIDVSRIRPQSFDGRTLIYVEPVVRDGAAAVAKRVFDMVVASVILLLSLPLWVLASIAIKSTSRGPVFFRQQRVGLHGELFTMTKFRTMEVGAEERLHEFEALNESDGPLFKMERDPRVTGVGRLLRRLSIDELPQLVTVLKGQMSMVGPRPALPHEIADWEPELFERLRVLPGLTGMWQVSGRAHTSFDAYRRLDLYYVDNWSLAHDVRICAKTIVAVVTCRGAA